MYQRIWGCAVTDQSIYVGVRYRVSSRVKINVFVPAVFSLHFFGCIKEFGDVP